MSSKGSKGFQKMSVDGEKAESLRRKKLSHLWSHCGSASPVRFSRQVEAGEHIMILAVDRIVGQGLATPDALFNRALQLSLIGLASSFLTLGPIMHQISRYAPAAKACVSTAQKLGILDAGCKHGS